MIFIGLKNNDITTIHHMPFDTRYGLGKTEEELQQEGLLVEELPQAEEMPGKHAVLKYNGTEIYYEYEDVPLTETERIAQLEAENESLRASQAEQDALIMELMIGGTL